jgi:hypothetical protein
VMPAVQHGIIATACLRRGWRQDEPGRHKEGHCRQSRPPGVGCLWPHYPIRPVRIEPR